MEKIEEVKGINCLDYKIVNKTRNRRCDDCEFEPTNCVKLLFAGDDYICVEKVK